MEIKHSQCPDEMDACSGFATGRAAISKDRLTHLWDTLEPNRLVQGEQQGDGSQEKQSNYLKEWQSYFYKGIPSEQRK